MIAQKAPPLLRRATFLCILCVAGCLRIFGATYYIDYTNGADTNNGTAEATPWAHAPGMVGCANNCASHTVTAGDSFIFHGGITWPFGTLPMTIETSGSSTSNVYYGVNTSWYNGTNSGTVTTNGTTVYWASGNAFYHGGAWNGGTITINGTNYTISSVLSPYALTLTTSAGTQASVPYSNSLFVRPVLNGSYDVGSLISLSSGVSYITIDSLELRGDLMIGAAGGYNSIVVNGATNGNLIFENLDIHDWKYCTGSGIPSSVCSAALTDDSWNGGGIYFSMYSGLSSANIEVLYSNIGNPENGSNSGACIRGAQIVIGNYLHDCPQANLHGGQLIHDNTVYRVGLTFDSSEHTNIFYADCLDQQCGSSSSSLTSYIYNNWIIDVQGNANDAVIYPNPGSSGVSSSGTVTYYVFDNVVSCNTSNGCVATAGNNVDPYGLPSGAKAHIYDWNNTYDLAATGTCVLATARSGISITSLDVRNLHCIVPSGGATVTPNNVTTYTNSSLLLQTNTTANGQGYGAPSWGPANGSTVGAGTNLTSDCAESLVALCSSTTLGGTIASLNSRPSTGNWDEGAYSYAFSATPSIPPSVTATVR